MSGCAASVSRLRLIAAVPWSETAVSQFEAFEKSSLRMIDPIPGFISGRRVLVGKAFSVGVADGGNQIMVAVGSGVSEGTGVSVGEIGSDGRQALRINVIVMTMYPSRRGYCFVAIAPRNDRWCVCRME